MRENARFPSGVRLLRRAGCSLLAAIIFAVLPGYAIAASGWDSTLLLNPESFNTVDSGDGTTNIELRFGSSTILEKLISDVTNQRFDFSRNLYVHGDVTATGSLIIPGVTSGSSLTVDTSVTLQGVPYALPATSGSYGRVLTTNGGGALSWTTQTVGTGSVVVVFLSPEYPDAVYFGSGSSDIGQLSNAYDATNKENYYHWTSTKTGIQDYWIAVRIRVPNNFSTWDTTKPITMRYRTGDASNAVNFVNLRLLDTTGANVALTNGSTLANTSWTTATVTGPQSTGTYTKDGYITLLIKLATTSSGSADLGWIQLKWETATP